jgi:hypothetical protein
MEQILQLTAFETELMPGKIKQSVLLLIKVREATLPISVLIIRVADLAIGIYQRNLS